MCVYLYTIQDGIDAGGLAKDWFMTVTKALLSNTDTSNTTDEEEKRASFNIIYETEYGIYIYEHN